MKTKNNGFTLIELLVVVIIFGVLAAIALPNITGGGKKKFMEECAEARFSTAQCTFLERVNN